ncbi:MAG: hypothetical protein EBT83_17580, partial [Betaproteobacteria bacterium]|nr:hypothetical protein [Betaproteobacteria bacterium]
ALQRRGIESRFNPQAQNPTTRATGLIQFMPSTAKGSPCCAATSDSMSWLLSMSALPLRDRAIAHPRCFPRIRGWCGRSRTGPSPRRCE